MREIKCTNCEYKWEYKGKSKFYASCPRCLRKVKLEQNLDNNSSNCIICNSPITIKGDNIRFSCSCFSNKKYDIIYEYKDEN